MTLYPVKGAGLGLRRGFIEAPELMSNHPVDFFEVAPENWIRFGGKLGRHFKRVTERVPLVCHGLSLSLGGLDPFDEDYLTDIKVFLKDHRVCCYSEHLSYCADQGQLYDLMPIPFTEEAVRHVAGRIRYVQDFLEQKIAIENVSYYAAPGQEMDELTFLKAVLEEADCDLLLDVNNIYVNSVNHRYDANAFLQALPAQRIAYVHVAGHYNEAEDLIVDTHGAAVIDPVWSLLKTAYAQFGVVPTLLERDFNFPPMDQLFAEVLQIKKLQARVAVADIELQPYTHVR